MRKLIGPSTSLRTNRARFGFAPAGLLVLLLLVAGLGLVVARTTNLANVFQKPKAAGIAETLPGTGEVQTESTIVLGNNLFWGVWQGNKGYVRTVPIVGGRPVLDSTNSWSAPIDPGGLPGSGDVLSQDEIVYANGTKLNQAVWRGHKGQNDSFGYARNVPISGTEINWSGAGPWSTGIGITAGSVGSGDVQDDSSFTLGNVLYQGHWRGNLGYSRTVPVVNGDILWSGAGAWSVPIAPSSLGGTGDVQGNSSFVIGNYIWQTYYRANVHYVRAVPVKNNQPDWGSASEWANSFAAVVLPAAVVPPPPPPSSTCTGTACTGCGETANCHDFDANINACKNKPGCVEDFGKCSGRYCIAPCGGVGDENTCKINGCTWHPECAKPRDGGGGGGEKCPHPGDKNLCPVITCPDGFRGQEERICDTDYTWGDCEKGTSWCNANGHGPKTSAPASGDSGAGQVYLGER